MTGPSPLRDGIDGIYLPEAMAQRAVKQALNDWRQGDLVYGVRLFWAAPADDELTGLSVDDPGDGRWAVISWDGAPATAEDASDTGEAAGGGSPSWGIITSQTCDVVATGPGRRHPTVQVSPLLEAHRRVRRGDGHRDSPWRESRPRARAGRADPRRVGR